MEKRLLSIAEAAEYIGIRKETLYCWVSQKRIPYVKMGRRTMFDLRDIETMITDNRVPEEKIIEN